MSRSADPKETGTAPTGERKNRRVRGRTRRRFMVRYGTVTLNRTGFTKDVSETGLFIRTNRVEVPGSTLQLEVQFPEKTFQMWARVAWAKKVPAQLAHIIECGMGVCFINPPADWLAFFRDWKAKIGMAD